MHARWSMTSEKHRLLCYLLERLKLGWPIEQVSNAKRVFRNVKLSNGLKEGREEVDVTESNRSKSRYNVRTKPFHTFTARSHCCRRQDSEISNREQRREIRMHSFNLPIRMEPNGSCTSITELQLQSPIARFNQFVYQQADSMHCLRRRRRRQ